MPSNGIAVATKLALISQRAHEHPTERFNNLLHLLSVEFLRDCFLSLRHDAAAGIDHVTYQEYAQVADVRLPALAAALHRMSYRPLPVRRVHIPKDAHSTRPLGIPALEDKIVQEGFRRILLAIFEEEFLDCSHGFRPKRGCTTALRALDDAVMGQPINYVIDADIKGFFDSVDHDLLLQCVERRVSDPRVLRYLRRFLKAGVLEEGVVQETSRGVPQGGLISPILANIFLHYGLDRWFTNTVQPRLRGVACLVRYADDFIIGLQHEADAVVMLEQLHRRLTRCKLELAPEKTRVLVFGRFAASHARTSRFVPGTFDFLGFTHYWGKTRATGKGHLRRRTSRKRFCQKVRAMKTWITRSRHAMDRPTFWRKLNQKLQGHYAYYGVRGNSRAIERFYCLTLWMVRRLLNRCSRVPRWSSVQAFDAYCRRYPVVTPHIAHLL
jgi:RNA-directed DNA polymerase